MEALRLLFQSYHAAFERLDPAAISDCYLLPCATSDGDGNAVFADLQSLRNKFALNCQQLQAAGYTSSDFEILEYQPLGDHAASVKVAWSVSFNEQQQHFGTLYLCHLVAERWKIFSAQVFPF
ncbi:hypothetical protein DU002_00750 [Corallincola holothuriorum]|uniref:Nuclear transport factor 2 domain-containing protein n=1 Tax=Corallincola holothuriorum TaxID=2282215 RepID=A0A368NTI7_9GAMM|nr:ketosteroid isomerase family protein [Corallincola holothuriorum]RCU52531.1 hypothetical protein DU002_00750 [Corallincola holothuriorum]